MSGIRDRAARLVRLMNIGVRTGKATPGPWMFGTAPAEGSEETKAEFMARALTDEGPLYALYVPTTVGQPGGYLIPAITGDGRNAGNNAEFIANARDDVPWLLDLVQTQDMALGAVLALHVANADPDPFEHYCIGCWEAGGEDGAPAWPCPTVRAINDALGGE